MPKTSTAPQPTPRAAQRRVAAAHSLSPHNPHPSRPHPLHGDAQLQGSSAPFQSKAQHVTRRSDTTLPGGRGLTFWGQWLIGISLTTLLLGALAILKTGDMGTQYRVLAVFALLASVPAYALLRVYHKQHGYLTGLTRLLGGWLLLLAALTVVAFITKTSELFSREVTLTWALLGFALQAGSYLPLHHVSRRYHQQLQSDRTSLIVGTGDLALELADQLVRNQHEPVVGLIASDSAELPSNSLYPILGGLEHLRALIAEHNIRRLYIALPLAEAEQIEGLYIDLLDASVDVVWIPDLASMMLLNHSVSDIGGLPAIHLNESPLTAYPTAALTKAALDRILALLAIIAFSPLMLVIAILIKRSSPGPILFKQQRHGWNGQVIKVYKFRSMRMHDDRQVKQATREDPRITPIGRFIRRTSIDELPQFFNVLQGRMSLVGPRPHAVAHNDYYTGKIDAYMARHRIKPGITGLAQISGCRGETETLDKMQKRVELDLAYINNWSVWLDIKILIKTPLSLLSKDIY
ncbi:putative colanic acid biosysnthesis UDP-glucose lipid carrier transferase [Pseudomonas linyingensis]|uniref:Putative colanic acid biosysnthesis UDP-glucose lipid carrier transferase n=1 Tax=Pseudomonas linyingensis TaxID=915471 RepID=A0A1H6XAC4_9PSED|nr:putative colanic acid biosysnthesis UDP-glucose lipid carrier transferase [Pseudomonas linyingensis]